MLRGTVFSDRGVYRLGEEVHFKAILRQNTPTGIRLLRAGTPVVITLRDSQYRLVDERTVTMNEWSSADWTITLPAEGALGNYTVRAMLEADKPKPRRPRRWSRATAGSVPRRVGFPTEKAVNGSFLVAAYRRPDFRVDVTLTGRSRAGRRAAQGRRHRALSVRRADGDQAGQVVASHGRPSRSAPAAVYEKFPEERWVFVGMERSPGSGGAARKLAGTKRS